MISDDPVMISSLLSQFLRNDFCLFLEAKTRWLWIIDELWASSLSHSSIMTLFPFSFSFTSSLTWITVSIRSTVHCHVIALTFYIHHCPSFPSYLIPKHSKTRHAVLLKENNEWYGEDLFFSLITEMCQWFHIPIYKRLLSVNSHSHWLLFNFFPLLKI